MIGTAPSEPLPADTTTDDIATAATIAIEACTAILESNIRLTDDIERISARCHALEVENDHLQQIIVAAQQEIDRRALLLSRLLHARKGLPIR